MTTFCHTEIFMTILKRQRICGVYMYSMILVLLFNLIAVNLKAVKLIGWNTRQILMWHGNKSKNGTHSSNSSCPRLIRNRGRCTINPCGYQHKSNEYRASRNYVVGGVSSLPRSGVFRDHHHFVAQCLLRNLPAPMPFSPWKRMQASWGKTQPHSHAT